MKHFSNRILSLSILLVLVACDTFQKGPENLTKADYQTIKINNNYSLDLPNYMSEGELHDEASLEYQHLFKEVYVIVIDENIEEAKESISYYDTYKVENSFIENYIDFQKDGFDEGSDILYMSETRDLKINGLSAKQFDMTLDIPDLDEHIVYLATFIESQENIYMLMKWTLEERKERYIETFKAIANSFKLQKRRSKTKRN